MKVINKSLITAALLTTVSMANAGTVSLPNGISFEALPIGNVDEAEGNFQTSFDFVQWWEDDTNAGLETSLTTIFSGGNYADDKYSLNGYGELTSLNTGLGAFNCNGCEMTFSFGGLGLKVTETDNPAYALGLSTFLGLVPGSVEADFVSHPLYAVFGSPVKTYQQASLDLDSAFMDIYVDYTPDLDLITGLVANGDVLTAEHNALDSGAPWLTLSFKEVELTPKGISTSTGLPDDGVAGLSAADTSFGLIATGGDAYDNFLNAPDLRSVNTDKLDEFVDMIAFGLSGSFIEESNVYRVISKASTGTVGGIAVPEPTSVAIFGLALLGFAGAARRKQSK